MRDTGGDARRVPGVEQPYLGEVQHAGAEGRGGAEQRLYEATAQLESLGHTPQVRLLHQGEEDQGQVQAAGDGHVHILGERPGEGGGGHEDLHWKSSLV